MAKAKQTPQAVLNKLMNEYQLNAFSLSKAIKLSPTSVRLIVIGKSKITVPTALRLAKFFGQSPAYWLDLQNDADLADAARDGKLQSAVNSIGKVKKPAPKAKAAAKPAKKAKKAGAKKAKAPARGKKPAAMKAGAKKAVKKPAAKKAVKKSVKKAVKKPAAKRAVKKAAPKA